MLLLVQIQLVVIAPEPYCCALIQLDFEPARVVSHSYVLQYAAPSAALMFADQARVSPWPACLHWLAFHQAEF